MVILADSGSTKTDWAIRRDNGEVLQLQTRGLNPYFTSLETFHDVFQHEVLPEAATNEGFAIHFYGAGFGNAMHREQISRFFYDQGAENVEVETDLLGAGRALFQHEKGIVAILGTGANAGVYGSTRILQTAPSLGYVLGDEGSACWLGKAILTARLRGTLDPVLNSLFDEHFSDSREEIITAIYQKERPNYFIARFAAILQEMHHHPWTEDLVKDGFRRFLQSYVMPLSAKGEMEIRAVGSIACHFFSFFEEEASALGYKTTQCSNNIIQGLLQFHSVV